MRRVEEGGEVGIREKLGLCGGVGEGDMAGGKRSMWSGWGSREVKR